MMFALVNLSARFALLRFTIGIVLLTLTSPCESLTKTAWILACSLIEAKTFGQSLKVFNLMPRLRMLLVPWWRRKASYLHACKCQHW